MEKIFFVIFVFSFLAFGNADEGYYDWRQQQKDEKEAYLRAQLEKEKILKDRLQEVELKRRAMAEENQKKIDEMKKDAEKMR